jgi:hypothetical protein
MKKTRTALLTILCLIALIACDQSTKPSHVPAPDTDPLRGVAYATALRNLDTVQRLENQTGHSSSLVEIVGTPAFDGHLVEHTTWGYTFSDGSQRAMHYQWQVDAQGAITQIGPVIDTRPLGTLSGLAIDSDTAVPIAIASGGQAFLDQFPNAKVQMGVRSIGTATAWSVTLRADPGPSCAYGPFVIDALTGALISKNISCRF